MAQQGSHRRGGELHAAAALRCLRAAEDRPPAFGYDHGYDSEVFYLGLALDPAYIEGWIEGCLERIGEDHPEEERLFRDLWEDKTQREMVIESLKADCEVRTGRPTG